MADAQAPAPAPSRAPVWTPELIRYVATLGILAVLVGVLALSGQRDGMNTVLGALAGYATSGHPGNAASQSTVAAATMGLAFASGAIGHALST